MRSSHRGRAAMAFVILCAGCFSQDTFSPSQRDAGNSSSGKTPRMGVKWGQLPTIANTRTQQTFTAGADTWWENITGGEIVCTSGDSAWAKYDSCASLMLQRFGEARVARTYLAIDFDTTPIPDDAIITSAPKLRLSLAYASKDSTLATPPPPLGCPPCFPCEYPSPFCGEGCGFAGVYFAEVDTVGARMAWARFVITECPSSPAFFRASCCNEIIGYGVGQYAEIGVPDGFVSATRVTRYSIDLENQRPETAYLFQFNSADAAQHKPLLDVEWTRYDFYGAAMGGPDWAGFDTLLCPDLETNASWEALSESLYVYLVWQNSGATGLHKLNSPIRIDQAPWWNASGFSADDFTITVVDPEIDAEYHACPSGEGLQEFHLNDDGTLSVKDLNFGGIGSQTRIKLRANHPDPDSALVRVIILQWDHPGTYYDAELEAEVDAAPDGSHTGIVVQKDAIDVDAGLHFPLRFPTRIVEWVSSDISGVDPIRVVDEADLAALCAELGHAVNWGFDDETPNYPVNVNTFGASALYIDAADLGLFVTDLGDSCAGVSKPGVGGPPVANDRDRILEWFGIMATGQMVQAGPAGDLVPGYEVVDLDQNRRAIGDPYGWRRLEP